MIYDWTITSGGAIRELQKFLKNNYAADLKVDGILGKEVRGVLNGMSGGATILSEIAVLRKAYYANEANRSDRPGNMNFLEGWLRRVDACLKVDL